GSAGAPADRRNPRIRKRRGGGTGQPAGDRLHRPHPGRGQRRRSPVARLPRDQRLQTGSGLHDCRNRTWPSRGSGAVNAREQLLELPFDPELAPGARNAVVHCLRIRPEEKVTLITDLACRDIAAGLAGELQRHRLEFNAFILEELAPRPLTDMPRAVLDDMETSQVSIFAVRAQANELRTRMQMTDVVNRRQMRHAHMVNIDRRIMLEGMRADFDEVDRISTQVWRMASAAREIRATNPAGTHLVAQFSPHLKWLKTSGIISPHKWGNLPGGETFTTPERVDGTFVIDGVVGDYLCEKYGD